MDTTNDRQQSGEIVAHYETVFAVEAARLDRDAPVEYAITARQLRSRIRNGAIVADIGVGVGHYAQLLAEMACELHLVDISRTFLEATQQRLASLGLASQIAERYLRSATDLEVIGAASCDVVLLLGPLYHLPTAEERRLAVSQAARILKPDGLLFAAGINRLAYLRDLLNDNASAVEERRDFHDTFLEVGTLTPEVAPGIGFAHLTTVSEFRRLFDGLFCEAMYLGVESFAAAAQTRIDTLPFAQKEAWLDLIERTASTPEGLAAADHFLFIGRRI